MYGDGGDGRMVRKMKFDFVFQQNGLPLSHFLVQCVDLLGKIIKLSLPLSHTVVHEKVKPPPRPQTNESAGAHMTFKCVINTIIIIIWHDKSVRIRGLHCVTHSQRLGRSAGFLLSYYHFVRNQ